MFIAPIIAWLLTLSGASAVNGQPAVVINELQASNNTTLADEDGDYEDWIELYNTGVDTVNVSWFGLSDDPGRPFRWTLPPGTEIAPGEFLLIWASGKDRSDPANPLHTGFSIAQAGEPILLTHFQGTRIDEVAPTRIPSDISYGRYPDGAQEWYFFTEPSPGAPNTKPAYRGQAADPVLSHQGGFYQREIVLEATASAGDTIRYTLDGSEPTLSDPIMPDSFRIGVREPADKLLSQIPTNPPETSEQHAWKEPAVTPFLATVLRMRAFNGDAMPSRIATHTFFVSGDDPADTRPFADRYPLPVISLATDSLSLFDHETGIYIPGKRYEDNWYVPPWGHPYANYFNRGMAWERPASMEFFDPEQGRLHHQDIGIRIHGAMSRAMPMKSLRLYARSEYGERRFEYAFFDHPDSHPEYQASGGSADEPPSYNRLILRNSGQDFYRSSTLFRDAMSQGLVSHLNMDTQAYRPAIVFINGEYWGIMNIRERYDRHYLARTYGLDPDHVDYLGALSTVTEGDRIHYQEYRNYLRDHNLPDGLHYAHISTLLDIDNFLDYNIANIYINNLDWPGNNREYFRARTEYDPDAPPGLDGRWRYMLIDTDYGFGHQNRWDDAYHDMLAVATGTPSDEAPNPTWSTIELRKLLENPEFRHRFITRFADYLNSFLASEYVVRHIDHYRKLLDPVIEEHIDRWGYPLRRSSWESHIEVMNHFAEKRPFHMREHLMHYFDLGDTVTVTLDVNGPPRSGHIRINEMAVNGHTRGVSDTPYPWSGIYFTEVPVEVTAIPRSGYRFAGWAEFPDHSSAQMTLVPDGDITLTALFEIDESPDHVPASHNLADGPFNFGYWPGDAPPGSFPDHMHFLYMDRKHPGTEAWPAGTIDMPYNRDTGTRLLGLGDQGIAFANSDSDGDAMDPYEHRLGGALVGLRTIDHHFIDVSWTAETIQPNDRDYALRLEYRTDTDEPFRPVLDHRNLPVLYRSNDQPGHKAVVGPVTLPGDAENQPYVQLMWRYYKMSDAGSGKAAGIDETAANEPGSGAGEIRQNERADSDVPAGSQSASPGKSGADSETGSGGNPPILRLDDIYITSTPLAADEEEVPVPEAFSLLQNYPNPFNHQTLLPFELAQPGRVTVTVYSIDGRLVNRYEEGRLQAGSHVLTIRMAGWASGMYLAQIQVISDGGEVLYRGSRGMTLIK
ncbi:CotH kinase family protein [Balneolales bacterium ANBcel1]|nr:CotH kinase family protein [Balneolales bacterium ANBcel1]